ncbi:MAG: hypothetical protein ACRD1X_12955 [Vicinamibacteria bacterium]
MNQRPLDLVFEEIVPEVGPHLKVEELYMDNEPLTDVFLSERGGLVCLRKSDKAGDLLYFDSVTSQPTVWVSDPELRFSKLCGFSGERVYAFTENKLLKLGPSRIEIMYSCSAPIQNPTLSPDGTRIAWVEGNRWRGRVLETRNLDENRPIAVGTCHDAVWLGSGELLTFEIVGSDMSPEETVFSLYADRGTPFEQVFSTRFGIIKMAGDPYGRNAVLEAARQEDHRSGVWLMTFEGEPSVQPIVTASSLASLALRDGWCFFGAAGPNVPPHELIVAGKGRSIRAQVDSPIADFSVDSTLEWIVYRTFSRQGSIRRVFIHDLVSRL